MMQLITPSLQSIGLTATVRYLRAVLVLCQQCWMWQWLLDGWTVGSSGYTRRRCQRASRHMQMWSCRVPGNRTEAEETAARTSTPSSASSHSHSNSATSTAAAARSIQSLSCCHCYRISDRFWPFLPQYSLSC